MAQTDIRGNIILDGQTTSGFDSLAGRVRSLGQAFKMISDEIWEFEKDSLEVYKGYETNMLQARAALSSTYDDSADLDKVMKQLGEHVQDWAANSIFHISDFSQAVNNAAHAGWTLEQQLEGIPRAMLLAQAGGLDLSDGLEYLARALNVTGTDFKDSGTLVDQWVKASHLANLTIEDLGDSLNRMGVSAQLADNTAELFTMLDALANTGSVGSEAGTLLRGTIMRLIAPTKKATEAMQELEVTQEEYNELSGDSQALQEANQLLEKQGFSAYDTNGQLKPLMQTYGELYSALVAIAGSEEDLLKNSEVDKILAAIFPQRQISGALSFLQAVAKGWEDLYGAIEDSQGTAQADADIMMSGLMGAEELFKSKFERFKSRVGEELSGPFEDILGFLGGVVDNLNAMPKEQLDALLGGLTGIATLGTVFAGVGTAAWFLGMLGPWGVGALIAAGGLGALYGWLSTISEQKFESHFGEMAIDLEKLSDSMTELQTPGDDGRKVVEAWSSEVDDIISKYGELSETFSKELKFDTLTNKLLDDKDLEKLNNLGDQMEAEVLKGIATAASRDQAAVNAIFGVLSQEEYDALTPDDKTFYQALSDSFESLYGDLEGEAYEVGANLRSMLVEAFKDGDLSADEEAAIKAQIDRYNEIMTRIADYEYQHELKKSFYAAQRVSADTYEQWMETQSESYKAAIENRQDYWDDRMASLDQLYEEGRIKEEYSYEEQRWLSPEEVLARDKATLRRQRQADIDSTNEHYGQIVNEALNSTLYDTDWGDAWGFILDQYNKGNITIGKDGEVNFSHVDFSRQEDLDSLMRDLGGLYSNSGFFTNMLSLFGDYGPTQNLITLLEAMGLAADSVNEEINRRKLAEERKEPEESPEAYKEIKYASVIDYTNDLADLTNEYLQEQVTALENWIGRNGLDETDSRYNFDRWLEISDELTRRGVEGYDLSDNRTIVPYWYEDALAKWNLTRPEGYTEPESREGPIGNLKNLLDYVNLEIQRHERNIEEKSQDWWYNLTSGAAKDYAALHGGEWNPGGLYAQKEELEAQIAEEEAKGEEAAGGTPTVSPESQMQALGGTLHMPMDGSPKLQQLEEQGVTVEVAGDTTMLDATIEAEDGQTLMAYIDGDATNLSAEIYSEDGKTLLEYVEGNTSALASAIAAYNGRTVRVNVIGTRMFAEGGRATEPSIFGEGDTAEWAIPEEHTERTAALLNAARAASGFGSWDDTMPNDSSRGGSRPIVVNLNYNPTIIVGEAQSVGDTLEKDKERLEKLIRDTMQKAQESAALHDSVEVYA